MKETLKKTTGPIDLLPRPIFQASLGKHFDTRTFQTQLITYIKTIVTPARTFQFFECLYTMESPKIYSAHLALETATHIRFCTAKKPIRILGLLRTNESRIIFFSSP